MSEANLTGSGGGGGVPIGGTHFFPNAFPVDFVSKGQRFLRTGHVETDPAKFDAAIWAESVGSDWTRQSFFNTQYNDTITDAQSNGNTILMTENLISGVNPRVLRSNDNGASWTEQQSAVSGMNGHCFNAVDYGAGKFVLVGTGGLIATTTDGITYTQRATGQTTNPFYDVKWNGSMFVATGMGIIFTSPDGITWTSRAIPSALSGQQFYSVDFGNNTWVAVGAQGVCVTAPADGSTWTQRAITGAISAINGVYYDADTSKFYVGGGGVALSSSDGLSWATLTLNMGPSFGGSQAKWTKHNGYFYWVNSTAVVRTKDLSSVSYLYPRPSVNMSLRFVKKLRNGSLIASDGNGTGTIYFFKANLSPFAGYPVQVTHDSYALEAWRQLIAYVRIS
jgi:hypothetical protein